MIACPDQRSRPKRGNSLLVGIHRTRRDEADRSIVREYRLWEYVEVTDTVR